jgi:lipopolysaccharide transport system ATP-binding protein
MSKPIIEIQGVGKRYRIGGLRARSNYLSLRDEISKNLSSVARRLSRLSRPESPVPGRTEDFWALRHVSFSVDEGEAMGIIGRNGAGKSTLLKVLSQITPPTEGRITMRGRVASLLEVGTGFHPELTGRENVYLNGSILGMTRGEIRRKFDEIVAFSEVEQFLETPVKRYSSGMYVRLAFAVAAHLDPEILLVDEVLAVGDAAFQKKCLGKMSEVAQSGRTVLFVSHNMAAIRRLCAKCVLLHDGRLLGPGATGEVVDRYLRPASEDRTTAERCFDVDLEKEFQMRAARLMDREGNPKTSFSCDEPVVIEMACQVHRRIPGLYGYLSLDRSDGTPVMISDSHDVPPNSLDELDVGLYSLRIQVPARSLAAGDYWVYVNFTSGASSRGFNVDTPGRVIYFHLDDHTTNRGNKRGGYFSVLLPWQVARIPDESGMQSVRPTGDPTMQSMP